MKENFQPVDGEQVLRKIRQFNLTSWNYIGQDAKTLRHYGPMAQDFYEAFGHDAIGAAGTPTTINSGDMAGVMMIAIKALATENVQLKSAVANQEAVNAEQQKDFKATVAVQQKQIEALTVGLQKVSAELEASKPAPQVVNNR
jgi:DNA mismatch repair ATPase MutS